MRRHDVVYSLTAASWKTYCSSPWWWQKCVLRERKRRECSSFAANLTGCVFDAAKKLWEERSVIKVKVRGFARRTKRLLNKKASALLALARLCPIFSVHLNVTVIAKIAEPSKNIETNIGKPKNIRALNIGRFVPNKQWQSAKKAVLGSPHPA